MALVGVDGHVADAEPLAGAQFEDPPEHATAVFIGQAERGGADADFGQAAEQRGEGIESDEVQPRDRAGEAGQAGARRHADRGGHPDRRGGGETVHRVAADDDQPGAEKANAGNDLGRHPRRVEDDVLVDQDIGEAVLADQHDQRGGDTDDGVRTEAGGLLLELAFEADEGRQEEGEAQFGELGKALTAGNVQHDAVLPSTGRITGLAGRGRCERTPSPA